MVKAVLDRTSTQSCLLKLAENNIFSLVGISFAVEIVFRHIIIGIERIVIKVVVFPVVLLLFFPFAQLFFFFIIIILFI